MELDWYNSTREQSASVSATYYYTSWASIASMVRHHLFQTFALARTTSLYFFEPKLETSATVLSKQQDRSYSRMTSISRRDHAPGGRRRRHHDCFACVFHLHAST